MNLRSLFEYEVKSDASNDLKHCGFALVSFIHMRRLHPEEALGEILIDTFSWAIDRLEKLKEDGNWDAANELLMELGYFLTATSLPRTTPVPTSNSLIVNVERAVMASSRESYKLIFQLSTVLIDALDWIGRGLLGEWLGWLRRNCRNIVSILATDGSFLSSFLF